MTRWPDKRLIGSGELHLLWTDAGERADTERDGEYPSIVLPGGLPPRRELLGAACAWLCLLVCALYLAVVLIRWAWVVIAG